MWASHGLTLWLPLYWRLHFHRCLMACMRKASQPLWRITSERTASISSGSVSQRIRTTRRPIRTHLICPLSQSTRAVHEDDEGRIRSRRLKPPLPNIFSYENKLLHSCRATAPKANEAHDPSRAPDQPSQFSGVPHRAAKRGIIAICHYAGVGLASLQHCTRKHEPFRRGGAARLHSPTSDTRRVGEGCVTTIRSRCLSYHYKKK